MQVLIFIGWKKFNEEIHFKIAPMSHANVRVRCWWKLLKKWKISYGNQQKEEKVRLFLAMKFGEKTNAQLVITDLCVYSRMTPAHPARENFGNLSESVPRRRKILRISE